MIVGGARIYIVRVVGKEDAVTAPEAETILYSYRVPLPPAATTPAPAEATPDPKTTPTPAESKPNATSKSTAPTSPAKAIPRGKEPTILAGAFDPQFKDAAPEGALLVGFELGFGKWGNWDMIRTVRPVFQSASGETFG